MMIEYSFYLPFWDFVEYDEEDKPYVEESFSHLCQALHIEVDIERFHDQYYDNPHRAGEGDVYVFRNRLNPSSFMMLDTLHEPTDQCDMVKLGVRCDDSVSAEVKMYLLQLYDKDTPRTKIVESNGTDLLESIEPQHYPRMNKVYQQHIHYYIDGQQVTGW